MFLNQREQLVSMLSEGKANRAKKKNYHNLPWELLNMDNVLNLEREATTG